MALTYDNTKIVDRNLLHNSDDKDGNRPFPEGSPEDLEGDFQWAITRGIIFATMGIGMNRITEENWEKFAERLHVWQSAVGPLCHRDGKTYTVTARDVKRRIGLSTNASPYTDAQFKKRVWGHIIEDAEGKARREVRELNKEQDA